MSLLPKFQLPLDADLDVDLTQTVTLPTRAFNGELVNRVLETRRTVESTTSSALVSTTSAVPKSVLPPVAENQVPQCVSSSSTTTLVSVPHVSKSTVPVVPAVPAVPAVQRAITSVAATKASSAPVKRAATGVPVATPFAKLLAGCCFSVSGIANPERADLRRKVLECGGTYSHEWGPTCTHLICAAGFEKVDKFKAAARDDRTIVTAAYVHAMHAARCLQPLAVPSNAFRISTTEKLLSVPAAEELLPCSGHVAKKPKPATQPAADDDGTEEL
jgi:hypothetical protein